MFPAFPVRLGVLPAALANTMDTGPAAIFDRDDRNPSREVYLASGEFDLITTNSGVIGQLGILGLPRHVRPQPLHVLAHDTLVSKLRPVPVSRLSV